MKNTEQQPRSRFKYFVWTITALGHLVQRRHYHNWSDATVCREAVSALHIYLLEWAAERSKQGDKEPNPAIAYGLENEIAAAVDFLTAFADGETVGDFDGFFSAMNTFYKLDLLRAEHIPPEAYRRKAKGEKSYEESFGRN